MATVAQADMAYIANYEDGTISVINTVTNNIVKTINVGGNPYTVAVSPDGKRAYVSCSAYGSTNHRICVIDTTTHTVIANPIISTAWTVLGGTMAIRDSNFYISCEYSSICKLDMNTYARVGQPIPVGRDPVTMVIAPSNTHLYVTSIKDHTVSVINIVTNASVATIEVGLHPFGAAITPDGSKLYVANQGSNTVSVINTSDNTIVKTILVGGGPTGVAINPTGTRVYVTNNSGSAANGIPSNTISVIDTSTDTTIAAIPVGTAPVGVAVNLSGTLVYVANANSNNISVIDTITNKVVATIPVGSKPHTEGRFIGADPTVCKAEPDQCKTNPKSCGLFTQAEIDAAKQTGITQCKTDPVSCGIIVSTDQCKTNPASCNLFTQAQLDAAKQTGVDQCKANPTSCGITLVDTNGSTQTGIDQCKANPASCGITTTGTVTKIDGIATNALVTPTNKMIAGVLISGGAKRVMVRASSVDGAVDPLLEIVTYPDRKPLGSNDSWATDPAAAELTQKKLAPARATDAATILTLPPGLFTMEISSKNGGSGANVIEVYDMAVFP